MKYRRAIKILERQLDTLAARHLPNAVGKVAGARNYHIEADMSSVRAALELLRERDAIDDALGKAQELLNNRERKK